MGDELRSELEAAIMSRDPEQVRSVLARGADITTPWDDHGTLPVFKACAYGLPMLQPFLSFGVDVNSICILDSNWTLLMGAANLGRADVLKYLLENNADIHRKDKHGLTVIDHVSFTKYSPTAEIMQLLLDAGVDVNGHCHMSSLMCCDDSKVAVAKLLIKRGANVNFRSGLGTALTEAVSKKSRKMIELLLASGADPNLTTGDTDEHPNLTPLEYARALKLKPIVALLEEKLGDGEKKAAVNPLTWAQFEKAVIAAGRGDRLKSLRAASDSAALATLDKAAGGELPADFREFILLHDGQDGGETIVGDPEQPGEPFRILSVDQTAQQISWFKKNAKSMNGGDEITADDEVKAQYWNAKWIPIAENGGGDFLCLDMAPMKRGAAGQIILFDHESMHRRKVSDSFGVWLAEWIETFRR